MLGGLARVGSLPASPQIVVGSISSTARDAMRLEGVTAGLDTSSLKRVNPGHQSPAAANMCFYDNYRYQCGDWKWGNLRRQCEAEYRQGETCGLKAIWTTLPLADKCTMCERIERKQRRFEKHRSDCQRWVVEPKKYRCSIEKAREEMKDLAEEIQRLMAEKQARFNAIGNPRRA
ncbi:hypothetical protein LTR91_000185 [Friedmanniomyces endolithicus]|uniref:Uncharacterized protein n=2 Tax=Friedmanniomyces endolithicus TaxID=329885 RepID=A0AAN6L5T1_9PEZI|nr:hypothetical protein LTS09_008406 [Friedmanniomyces endolithicus]KAK0931237.1 hypothetical protein LTR57_000651 [Friedmanniomyces endolithicus]KAK1016166.1 hypothetical protein LTR91_000185 [Friedmanniomyces endolithicus]KAK1054562.1 hypothetical protein LTS16_000206 [Friedmanniomyces endolithicus]